jgi:hypothetical protein
MSASILVLDPLTLLGRELLSCGARLESLAADIEFAHTELEDEHQVAEIGSRPVLVPPLSGVDQLAHHEVVVVTSDIVSSRHDHLLELLDSRPDAAVLDVSRLPSLDGLVEPSLGRRPTRSRRLRVAHPALAAAAPVAGALRYLGRLHGTVHAIEPGSTFGREGVDLLVRQAAARLQGGTVEERIHGHILAFSTVAIDSADLQSEAFTLIPEVPLAVSRYLSGTFHGHLAALGFGFERALESREVEDVLEQVEGLEAVQFPFGLDAVPDSDQIISTPPSLSADRTQLSLALMVDGLRVGGVLTALDILETLV